MVFAINEINQNATLLPNLTLGFGIYDTCGAVHRGIEGALWMMSGQEVLVPGYRCLPGTPLAAIIGDAGSRISLAIARILGLYSYPLVRGTCTGLSNLYIRASVYIYTNIS